MKSTQARRADSWAGMLWEGLASLRFSAVLMAIIIGLLLAGSLIAQKATSPVPLDQLYSPDILYWLSWLGLTDLFHSGWFVFVLGLALLNLVCAAIDRLPGVFSEARQRSLPALNADHVVHPKRKDPRHVVVDLQSGVGREVFRDIVEGWVKRKVGKPQTLRDEGGLNELQLAVQTGRYARLWIYIAHLGMVLIVLGAAIGMLRGFSGKLSLDEGARAGYLEITRGSTQGWPQYKEHGRAIPGFYRPGFEIECARLDIRYEPVPGMDPDDVEPDTGQLQDVRSLLNFYQDGKLVGSREIGINHPATFEGLRFYQKGFSRHGRLGVDLRIRDRKTGAEDVMARVEPGREFQKDDTRFKLVDIRAKIGNMGPGAQIEYQEKGKPSESFWVFQRFPGFDAAHRKASRFIFSLDSVAEGATTELLIEKDPGAPLALAGGILLLIGLIGSLYGTHERYWFIWNPGRVTFVGSSSKRFLFEGKFQRAVNLLKAKIAREEKANA